MRASSPRIDAKVFAARRQLDAQQFFDRVMPGDFVGERRDVIHPVDDGDILIVVEVLAELFETAVQIANVGHGLDDGFAIEGEQEAQRRVRGRVLRAEVERPEIFLVGTVPPKRQARIGFQAAFAHLHCNGTHH